MVRSDRTGLASARRMSHGEQLARIARQAPDTEALRFGQSSRPFGQLDDRVDRLAAALSRRGVVAGDRVATLMMNRLEVVETYLAAAWLGAICVPVNFRLVAEEIAYIIKDSGARALVVGSDVGRGPHGGHRGGRRSVPAVRAGHHRVVPGRLAPYKKPPRVVATDALPRNASGKVLKTELRTKYVTD